MIVNFKKLNPDAIIPSFGNGDSENAGLDFYSTETVTIMPGKSVVIDTGIAWEPDMHGDWDTPSYTTFKPVMIIKGRSGLAIKHGVECCSAGIIDMSFRGSIVVKLYNTSDVIYTVNKGDRIAQGVVVALPELTVREVETLSDTERGTNGFGSSGK